MARVDEELRTTCARCGRLADAPVARPPWTLAGYWGSAALEPLVPSDDELPPPPPRPGETLALLASHPFHARVGDRFFTSRLVGAAAAARAGELDEDPLDHPGEVLLVEARLLSVEPARALVLDVLSVDDLPRRAPPSGAAPLLVIDEASPWASRSRVGLRRTRGGDRLLDWSVEGDVGATMLVRDLPSGPAALVEVGWDFEGDTLLAGCAPLDAAARALLDHLEARSRSSCASSG